jgi:hypothetical protein
MVDNDKMQNVTEMMSKMPEPERRMMMDKMMGMCMCHDCSTFKDCSMNTGCSPTPSMTSCMDPAMTSKKGLFCGMEGSMMPSSCQPQKRECMCTTCPVASDMGMDMTAPCMTKK